MINEAGLNLIKEFEGCKLTSYLDTLAKPPVWTIGYGHTGPRAFEGAVWSQAEADRVLSIDVCAFSGGVEDACVESPNENQLAAMTSLAYNIGIAAFRRSTVLRMHNAGKFAEAAAAFSMWNKAGGKVRAGLTRRRAAEASLYLTPVVAGVVQTTRAAPEDGKDPASGKVSPATIAAGVGGALTVAQQAVAQVQAIWDGLGQLGISPHIIMSALGVAAVITLGYFVYEAYQRRSEGDR